MEPTGQLICRFDRCNITYYCEQTRFASSIEQARVAAKTLLATKLKMDKIFTNVTLSRCTVRVYQNEGTRIVFAPLVTVDLPGLYSIEEFTRIVGYDDSSNETAWQEHYAEFLPKKSNENKDRS